MPRNSCRRAGRPSNSIGIDRRDPGGRSSVLVKWRTEALPANNVIRNAANFLAERNVIVWGADVGFFPEHESETQDKSAHEKHDVQVAIPGGLRRRIGICGSFRGSDRHTIYCGRRSRLAARWSWNLNFYAALGRRMSSSKEQVNAKKKRTMGWT